MSLDARSAPTLLNLYFLQIMLAPANPDAWKKFCVAARKRAFYQKNRELVRSRNKAWKSVNKERYAAQQREYRKINQPNMNLYLIDYNKKRRRKDPQKRMAESLRTRCYGAIFCQGGGKSNKTETLLGATWREVRKHLESTFKPGMSWENYGQWQIDHIRPCASFNLLDPEQQRECFRYTNLQALWKLDNLIKGDTWK